MNAYSYIKERVFVKLKPSRLQGIGVFAIRDIPQGTDLFQPWQGESGRYAISEEELLTLPTELYTHIKDIFLYGPDFPDNTDTYVTLQKGCHWVYTTPYYFINSGGEDSNVDKDSYKSTRFIKAGEELLSNYGRYERLKPNLL